MAVNYRYGLPCIVYSMVRYPVTLPPTVGQHNNKPRGSSPRLGLQNFSMPCLISTMRDSSVNDSMTLKLHRGLTSKKVMLFFSA